MTTPLKTFLVLSTVMFAGPCVMAQIAARPNTSEDSTTTRTGVEHRLSVFGGGGYQFETDMDSGGDFSVARFGAGASLQTNFNSDFSAGFQIGYGLDLYDFQGTALTVAPPSSPWDDIHTITLAAIFNLRLNTDWSVFAGPVLQSARESGGDFGDSITGGGLVGATYQLSDDLRIGGGVGVITQLEDDTRVFPIIIVEWEITESFHLRNTAPTNAMNRGGIELVYDTGRAWEFAFGVGSQFSRFRLDDDAFAPDGIGEDRSLPIWLRTTYKCSDRCSIDGVIGVIADGELRLENSTGGLIATSDYDPTFFAGLFGSLRF